MICVTLTPLLLQLLGILVHLLGRDIERDVVHRADGGHAVAILERFTAHALGRAREPEEGDAVDTVAHVEEEVLPASARQLERLHELHAQHLVVPSDGLGHVAAHEGKVVEAPNLELGVGVRDAGHASPNPWCDAIAYHRSHTVKQQGARPIDADRAALSWPGCLPRTSDGACGRGRRGLRARHRRCRLTTARRGSSTPAARR